MSPGGIFAINYCRRLF